MTKRATKSIETSKARKSEQVSDAKNATKGKKTAKTEPIVVAQIMGKWLGGGVESVIMNYYRHIDRSKIQFDFICDEDSTNIPYNEIENLGGACDSLPAIPKIAKVSEIFEATLPREEILYRALEYKYFECFSALCGKEGWRTGAHCA